MLRIREKTTHEQAISLPEPLSKQLLGDVVRGAAFLNTMPLSIPKAGVTFNGETLEVLPLNARNGQGTRNGHIDHADRTSTQEVEGPKDSLSSGAE